MPDDVRHFVNAAHERGLAVILDVVFNHFGPVGNFLRDFAPPFFGKPGEWGDSISYDAPDAGPVRAFVIENAAYWIGEFHFDGLRFDATHGINDSSSEHIVSEMCAAARAAAGDRRLFLVGESEPQDTRLLRGSGMYRDGLDAIWNEDWHHAAFVALTGRREAYFTDYRGTAGEFAAMARHGFLYQGQWYTWQEQPRGGTALGLKGGSIVNFLENHDQVANTGPGWRLSTHVDAALWRALTTLLLVGPQIPMLFQGQEFASSRPFTYFADHEGDLGEAVAKGRMEFLSQFPSLTTQEMQALVKRPSDKAAFEQCRLEHDERRSHASSVRLHRDLLRLRAEDEVLSRLGSEEVQVESSSPTETLLLVRYVSRHGDRLLVVNFGSDYLSPMNDPLLAPPRGMAWRDLWASEHPDYGNSAARPLAVDGAWLVRARSATILAAHAAS
jgi:maltooligosyltrehalose trehalohydrolase